MYKAFQFSCTDMSYTWLTTADWPLRWRKLHLRFNSEATGWKICSTVLLEAHRGWETWTRSKHQLRAALKISYFCNNHNTSQQSGDATFSNFSTQLYFCLSCSWPLLISLQTLSDPIHWQLSYLQYCCSQDGIWSKVLLSLTFSPSPSINEVFLRGFKISRYILCIDV